MTHPAPGLTNAQLTAAWRSKLPDVTTERELSAFARGVEYGMSHKPGNDEPVSHNAREPLSEKAIASICESEWQRAEDETARWVDNANEYCAPETKWTRYGTYVARAVEKHHGIHPKEGSTE